MDDITQNFATKLATSQTQLAALWTRIGISDVDQQGKWRTFVTDSLEAFLGNFKQLCYSEEKQLLVANDEALRELVALAGNLKTMPRDALLVDVLHAITGTTNEEQLASSSAPIESGRTRLPSFAELLASEAPHGSASAEGVTEARVTDALRRLSVALPTHGQVHQLLTSELKRLNDTANIRLAMLRLLHKQRALLRLSPEEQVALRTAYANKYITQCEPITVWAEKEPKPEVQKLAASAPPQRPSSQFASARSTDAEEGTAEDLDELHLLLTASLYNDVNNTRDTSFCLQPRPTRVSGPPTAMTEEVHADNKAVDGATSVPQASGHDGDSEPHLRMSLFEPDLSDIDRYGKRQDLSMERIRDEAAVILREVEQQNEVMQRQTESDVQCVEAAVVRWPGPPSTQPSRSCIMAQMKQEVSQLQAAFAQNLAAAHHHDGLAVSTSATPALSEDSLNGCGRANVCEEGVQLAEALPSSEVLAQCAVPTCIRQLFATNSYAPIQACARRYRDILVRHILREHRDRAHACHSALCEVARRYSVSVATAARATAKAATACAVTTSSTEQETGIPTALARQYSAAMAAVEAYCDPDTDPEKEEGRNNRLSRGAADAICTVHELQQLVDALDQTSDLLQGVSHVLQQRLSLLEQGAALLDKRDAILAEKRQMQEGSRERLLSKKVNMAKVLLHEENVRRRMAKELPAAMRQLASLTEAWEQLNEVHEQASGTMPSVMRMVGVAGPFVVGGVDVVELLAHHKQADARGEGTGRHGSISPRPAPTTTTTTVASQGTKRHRSVSTSQPSSQPAAGDQTQGARRRLASPALRPHHVNSSSAMLGKASRSVSPAPRVGSPVPSVFQRLHGASSSRTVKKREPSPQ